MYLYIARKKDVETACMVCIPFIWEITHKISFRILLSIENDYYSDIENTNSKLYFAKIK